MELLFSIYLDGGAVVKLEGLGLSILQIDF